MSTTSNRIFSAMIILATMTVAGHAEATDRSVGTSRKARVAIDTVDDSLYVSMRPELFAGKPVRVFCERLRNPDTVAMTCRSQGTSLLVDTRQLDSQTLRHAFENCRGMDSRCSGAVSGVADFSHGVPRIVQAEIEFVNE